MALTGTAKQVEWATQIIEAKRLEMEERRLVIQNGLFPERADALLAQWRLAEAHTDAAWWIDNRNHPGYQLAAEEFTAARHAARQAARMGRRDVRE